MLREAVLSECGRYRYSLTRVWTPNPDKRTFPTKQPLDVWVMLNPSIADADLDDPTIRRCIGFSRSWGAPGIAVVNLFPWRATDPKELRAAMLRGEDVVNRGQRNHHMSQVMGTGGGGGRVIVAWGATPWAAEEGERLRNWGGGPWHFQCLGVTRSGAPGHPLYLPRRRRLQNWTGA
jgi:hypothetical protein